MTLPWIARIAAAVVIAVGGLMWMNSFAPLQLPSVLAYSGIVVALFGLFTVLLPPAWSGFPNRALGLAAGALIGAVLFAAAWYWPAPRLRTDPPSSRLDAFMPEYNFHERHEMEINAPAERVRAALDAVSFADVGAMQTLGRIRAMAIRNTPAPSKQQPPAPQTPIVALVREGRTGFFVLDDNGGEFVFGLAGQPWANKGVRLTPDEFRTWSPGANVKIAANFKMEDLGNGRTRVITETRVAGNDEAARRKMGKYWALIYPGSGLIRRGLLRAVQERAERI